MPALAIIFGIEPLVAMPRPPHAVQSTAIALVPGLVARKLDMILHSRSLAAL